MYVHKLFGFLILGGGVAAGWQFMHPSLDMTTLVVPPHQGNAATQKVATQVVTDLSQPRAVPDNSKIAAAQVPRTFSPASPLFGQISHDEPKSTATASGPVSAVVTSALAPALTTATTTVSAHKPMVGDEAERGLVRDIQRELKRVGCYSGDATGQWSRATSRAMATFVGSSNASLPVDKPDVAFLAMLKSEAAERGCSHACGKGEISAGSGICVPRPTIATRDGAPAVVTKTPNATTVVTPTHTASISPSSSAPSSSAMGIGGPKVEAGDGDEPSVSPSIANPPLPARPTLDKAPVARGKIQAAAPPLQKPQKKTGNVRTSSSRDGTRAVHDIFLHPLGR